MFFAVVIYVLNHVSIYFSCSGERFSAVLLLSSRIVLQKKEIKTEFSFLGELFLYVYGGLILPKSENK